MFQAVVACPEPEDDYLLSSSQQVVRVCSVVAWMLLLPLVLQLGLDDGPGFGVAGRSVHLLLCSALLCQGVSSLIAEHVAVGGNSLPSDCVTCAEGGER